ncbi:MAG TPA: aminoacyl-tRNA hydrolase [Thermoanaerobaculia bacterium]|nr:aminoacyl-tRNA hydrolase [Thermoanaerobaculia bacterium]
MRLVVGLGNPGAKYERTRHNVGFRVLDAFAAKHRVAIATHEKDALTGKGRVAGQSVMLAKPLTFMNLSGKAVALLVRAYLESPADMLVVYDDIDLPLGKLRLRERGSAGTHNGMESILGSLETGGFPRLRFGIRGAGYSQSNDLARYVLDDFDPDEEPLVEEAIARASDALLLFVRGDLRRAMNTFNRDPETPRDDATPRDAV